MYNKKTILLLHIIKHHRNVDQLIREGLTYRNITLLVSDSVDNDLLRYEKDELELTELGEKVYAENRHLIKKKKKNEWIKEDVRSKIPKLSKKSLFLPNQNELNF